MSEPSRPPASETLREAAADLPLRDFDGTLERLADPTASHEKPGGLRMLTAALPEEVARFRSRLAELDREARRRMAQTLVDFGEADFQSDFRPLMLALLDDGDKLVRSIAIDGLWESRDLQLIERFTQMLREDPADEVRAHAASALGAFVELGELRDHLRARVAPALELLIDRAGDEREHPDVRRRALASAGYAEHPSLEALIERALTDDAIEVRAGALRAMGNSADDRWGEEVLAWLDEEEPELRFEAVRTAGELAVISAVNPLAYLADGEHIPAIRLEAVWALGEIGGKDAKRALEAIASDAEDDEALAEAIEDALSSCALIEGELSFASLDAAFDEDLEAEDFDEGDAFDDFDG